MAEETDQWSLLGTLSEPQRRAVYDLVAHAKAPLTRDEVAGAAEISRSLAAFHLDKLVEAGLLEATARPPAEGGVAKIGRPAKRYRRSGRHVELTVPPRRYALAGQILAAALEAADSGQPAVEAAERIAYERGLDLGAGRAREPVPEPVLPFCEARRALEDLGYQPVEHPDHLTLNNCPFDAIVAVAQQLVCHMNVALIDGVLTSSGLRDRVAPVLDPQPGRCCVTLLPTGSQPARST